MRLLRAKEFLKVIKGEDIEFRIKPYAIHVKEPVVIDGIKSKCSLNFTSLKFDSIEIKNSSFEGELNLGKLNGKNFSFNNSSAASIKILDATIAAVDIHDNNTIEEIYLDRSSINDLSLAKISNYNRLHLGCKNNILRATFSHIGNQHSGMAESSVYICPEQFGLIDLHQIYASKVEIGTFGEHAVLKADGIFTDDFKIKNCDNTRSQVALKNIMPLSESVGQLSIEDSVLDSTVMSADEMKKFAALSIENSEVGNLTNAVNELKKLHKARFWKRNITSLFLW